MRPLRRTARASAEPLSRALLSRSGLIQALMSCVRLRADPCAVRLLGERTAGVRPNRSQTHAADHRRPTLETPREWPRPTRRHRPPRPGHRLRTRRQDLHTRRQRHLAPHGAGREQPSGLRSLRPRPRAAGTRCRSRPFGPSARARSLLRADANHRGFRRARPRAPPHRDLTGLELAADPKVGGFSA